MFDNKKTFFPFVMIMSYAIKDNIKTVYLYVYTINAI